MTHTGDAAQQHYEAALAGLAQVRQCLPASELALLEEVRGHVEQAFWQSRLRQRVTRASVAATPYCRAIPLAPMQRNHVEALRQGMLAAERSFAEGGDVAPWNALLYGRYQRGKGHQRESFECGFVMRMFQLLHEACAEQPTDG
ncbi:hypothetical protein ACNFBT_25910 [Pseudomonas sp. NY15181]|uniref:hypothetical protein n=1 Tax=Pseudomonas sp. NY15181 TaxID=3400349 RepID=UPI003A84A453